MKITYCSKYTAIGEKTFSSQTMGMIFNLCGKYNMWVWHGVIAFKLNQMTAIKNQIIEYYLKKDVKAKTRDCIYTVLCD